MNEVLCKKLERLHKNQPLFYAFQQSAAPFFVDLHFENDNKNPCFCKFCPIIEKYFFVSNFIQ